MNERLPSKRTGEITLSLRWIRWARSGPAEIYGIVVTSCGRICMAQKLSLSAVFAGQAIGIQEVSQ